MSVVNGTAGVDETALVKKIERRRSVAKSRMSVFVPETTKDPFIEELEIRMADYEVLRGPRDPGAKEPRLWSAADLAMSVAEEGSEALEDYLGSMGRDGEVLFEEYVRLLGIANKRVAARLRGDAGRLPGESDGPLESSSVQASPRGGSLHYHQGGTGGEDGGSSSGAGGVGVGGGGGGGGDLRHGAPSSHTPVDGSDHEDEDEDVDKQQQRAERKQKEESQLAEKNRQIALEEMVQNFYGKKLTMSSEERARRNFNVVPGMRRIMAGRLTFNAQKLLTEMQKRVQGNRKGGNAAAAVSPEKDDPNRVVAVDLDLRVVLQPSLLPGEEQEAHAALARKAAAVQQAADAMLSTRSYDASLEARYHREKREFEEFKEILEAQRFFGGDAHHASGGSTSHANHGHGHGHGERESTMSTMAGGSGILSSVEGRREKIAAWLQSRRISAVRAASQTITYQGMVAELDKRVEAVQQATLYEVNLRNREQVKTYLRRTDGLARLTKLVDSNPERAMRKPFKEFEAELQAVRIWSEMVRVQETRRVVRECDWLGALMDDVEESLRAGVCTETEKILMSAVLQRVIEGLEFTRDDMIETLKHTKTADMYIINAQDFTTKIFQEVLNLWSEAEVAPIFTAAYGLDGAGDAMRAFALRQQNRARSDAEVDYKKKWNAATKAINRGRAEAGTRDTKSALKARTRMQYVMHKSQEQMLERDVNKITGLQRWYFLRDQVTMRDLIRANRRCRQGDCETCVAEGWYRTQPTLITHLRNQRLAHTRTIEDRIREEDERQVRLTYTPHLVLTPTPCTNPHTLYQSPP